MHASVGPTAYYQMREQFIGLRYRRFGSIQEAFEKYFEFRSVHHGPPTARFRSWAA